MKPRRIAYFFNCIAKYQIDSAAINVASGFHRKKSCNARGTWGELCASFIFTRSHVLRECYHWVISATLELPKDIEAKLRRESPNLTGFLTSNLETEPLKCPDSLCAGNAREPTVAGLIAELEVSR